MVSKKKYHGGLKLLLLLLFIMLLNMYSICYALQPTNEINAEFANAFFDKIEENIEKTYYGNYQASTLSSFRSFRQNVNVNQFVTDWNNNVSVEKFPYLEQVIFVLGNNNVTNKIYIVQNNNGIGNVLPNFWLGYHSSVNNYYIYKNFFTNGNSEYGSGSGQAISWNSNGTYTFDNPYTKSTSYYSMAILQELCILQNITYSDNSLCYIPGAFGYKHQFIFISPDIQNSRNGNWYWNTNIIDYDFTPPVDPEEPSGDTSGDNTTGQITNPSGEITGTINLQPIEESLGRIEDKIPTSGDIQNAISGEVGKITETITSQPNLNDATITSGDITNALGFEIEEDKYRNFWFTLTNDFKNALLGTKRTIDVSFQNRIWSISLDDFAVLPNWLKIILTPFSTCFFTWTLVRWWKLIIDKLSSGNVDALLKENSEEGISNLL